MNKKDLKIVFFGTPDFAVESLRAILDAGFNVEAVVTATDKIAGRGHKMLSSAVKKFAVEKGLNVIQPEKLKDEGFIEELRRINADLFVVIAFRMLPEIVWAMPRLGTFNLHASLLPKYRGAAPINRAVMNGEKQTGVTTFFLQHEIDTGDIIDRVKIDIAPEDDAGTVHDRLMELGARLTVKTINSIVEGTLQTVSQDALTSNGAETCPAPKIFKETGNIEWSMETEKIHNLIRGLSPYPGAWSTLYSRNAAPVEMKIFKSRTAGDLPMQTPGKVSIENGKMFVKCGDGCLEILEVQAAGKKRMSTDAFLRGARIEEGNFKKVGAEG